MKKQWIIAISLALVLTTISVIPTLLAEPQTMEVDLLAGQNIDVGTVYVTNDGDNITVTYETTDDWYITETHLYVGKNVPPISTPGQLPYSVPYETTETTHTYVIALDEIYSYQMKLNKKGKPTGQLEPYGTPGVNPGDNVYIAAHAVVCREVYVSGDLSDVEAGLPEQVTVLTTHSYPGYDQSYFQVLISGGTSLDGTYDGWCIDTDHNVHTVPYIANVYSSNGTLPYLEFLEYPENLDLVNYILNQHFVGESSPGGYGIYTFGDIQLAIWTLVDDYIPLWPEALDPYNLDRVAEIVADAQANGDGFVPGCGDVVAIILEPTEIVYPVGQLAIIEVPINCEYETQCETAWGNGTQFGTNWAMYFTYEIQ